MPEFLQLQPPDEALTQYISNAILSPKPEVVGLEQALGRVTYSDVRAPHALPMFSRSTVDGYVVQAADTYGTSESLPIYLELVGEIEMGKSAELEIRRGQCAIIHTGGMLPDSADAVVMIEHTQVVSSREIEVFRAVAKGENIIKVGEDVRRDEVVIAAGVKLRPAEIGGLAALGIMECRVAQRPVCGILSGGDEVVPPSMDVLPGQVRDVNSYSLSALIAEAGGTPIRYGIYPDRLDVLEKAARRAFAECDILIFTAGSSASVRDLTAQVISKLGNPGVLVHGVNVKPGKPTILAICKGKPVIGLPGNPVSALVIAELFLKPIIEKSLGLSIHQKKSYILARMTINWASQAGREDWVPVQLVPDGDAYLAEPVFGKSNMIFSLARADGLIRIPADATGVHAGDIVQVYPR